MQTKMRIHNLPGKSNPTTVFEIAVSESVVSDEDWKRVEVTYAHPASAQTAVMYPCLQSCGKGYAHFDAVQCEQSANASRYNLIEYSISTIFRIG